MPNPLPLDWMKPQSAVMRVYSAVPSVAEVNAVSASANFWKTTKAGKAVPVGIACEVKVIAPPGSMAVILGVPAVGRTIPRASVAASAGLTEMLNGAAVVKALTVTVAAVPA